MNTAVSAAVQAVRGRGRGTLTRGAFVGATAAPGYIAPGTVQPVRGLLPLLGHTLKNSISFIFWGYTQSLETQQKCKMGVSGNSKEENL